MLQSLLGESDFADGIEALTWMAGIHCLVTMPAIARHSQCALQSEASAIESTAANKSVHTARWQSEEKTIGSRQGTHEPRLAHTAQGTPWHANRRGLGWVWGWHEHGI